MGVYTFVCRSSAGAWSAKQLTGDLEGDASSTYELQRKLVQAVTASDSSGGIQSSFSLITPTSAVFQVIVGGGFGGGFGGGISAGVTSGGGGGGGSGGGGAAPEAPPAEEKKEEKEESDEDMGFSLFD